MVYHHHNLVFCVLSCIVMVNASFVNHKQARNPEVDTTISVVTPSYVSIVGEAPYYLESEQALYYVDIRGSDACRVDTRTGAVSRRNMGGFQVSMIIPYQNEPGSLLITRRHQLLRLNWSTGATSVIATISPELDGRERFNDAKCDPQGRLYIGTILADENGVTIPYGAALYRLDGSNFTRVAQGFTVANGMSWSNNGEEMYFNDSEDRKIYIFDYNVTTGEPSNQRLLIDVNQHQDFVADEYPDGQAIDAYGYVWISMWNGGRVVKIDPTTARVVDQVLIPNARGPTSLAFGDYRGQFGFYLTTASIGVPDEDRIDDGKVLHVGINGGRVGGFIPSSSL